MVGRKWFMVKFKYLPAISSLRIFLAVDRWGLRRLA